MELPPGLRGIGDLGETFESRQDGVVRDVVDVLVALAARAKSLLGAEGATVG